MNKLILIILGFVTIGATACQETPLKNARNPIIWADVPDVSMIRVDDTYYMSSTTMHMVPGVPIMKSKDLVNWELISYAYETLDDIEAFKLENNKEAYGGGTWASSLRHHNGTFYVSTFSNNTNKNYLFYTKDPNQTPWNKIEYEPKVHDHSLFFDDDGKTYIISCGGDVGIREMKADLTGIKDEQNTIVIKDADAITGKERMLPAEGAQMFKVNGKYYLFLITWPQNSMRTVLVYRADNIMGPYEGRVALEDKGVAQGGFINTLNGNWYGYFFRDNGSVGRIPYLVPMKWENEWPVFGNEEGKVPMELNIETMQPLIPKIVASDEFERKNQDADLPLVWQWNHNPNNDYWSVNERKGFLRLKTFRQDDSFVSARNTLTQRTFGPESSAQIKIDVSNMKNGDFAGLGLLQEHYGIVGVKMVEGKRYIYSEKVQNGGEDTGINQSEEIHLEANVVYLKTYCNFKERADIANFYYSTDGKKWNEIGGELKMTYTLSHFMGYRFALYNYATIEAGGYVDFDFFRINSQNN